MNGLYSCYVFVSGEREILDAVILHFDATILQSIGEIEVDDRGSVIAYAFESESAVDVDGLAKASKEWRGASVEAVWITKEEEVGTATINAGTIIDFVPLHKYMLIELLYASLAMRR